VCLLELAGRVVLRREAAARMARLRAKLLADADRPPGAKSFDSPKPRSKTVVPVRSPGGGIDAASSGVRKAKDTVARHVVPAMVLPRWESLEAFKLDKLDFSRLRPVPDKSDGNEALICTVCSRAAGSGEAILAISCSHAFCPPCFEAFLRKRWAALAAHEVAASEKEQIPCPKCNLCLHRQDVHTLTQEELVRVCEKVRRHHAAAAALAAGGADRAAGPDRQDGGSGDEHVSASPVSAKVHQTSRANSGGMFAVPAADGQKLRMSNSSPTTPTSALGAGSMETRRSWQPQSLQQQLGLPPGPPTLQTPPPNESLHQQATPTQQPRATPQQHNQAPQQPQPSQPAWHAPQAQQPLSSQLPQQQAQQVQQARQGQALVHPAGAPPVGSQHSPLLFSRQQQPPQTSQPFQSPLHMHQQGQHQEPPTPDQAQQQVPLQQSSQQQSPQQKQTQQLQQQQQTGRAQQLSKQLQPTQPLHMQPTPSPETPSRLSPLMPFPRNSLTQGGGRQQQGKGFQRSAGGIAGGSVNLPTGGATPGLDLSSPNFHRMTKNSTSSVGNASGSANGGQRTAGSTALNSPVALANKGYGSMQLPQGGSGAGAGNTPAGGCTNTLSVGSAPAAPANATASSSTGASGGPSATPGTSFRPQQSQQSQYPPGVAAALAGMQRGPGAGSLTLPPAGRSLGLLSSQGPVSSAALRQRSLAERPSTGAHAIGATSRQRSVVERTGAGHAGASQNVGMHAQQSSGGGLSRPIYPSTGPSGGVGHPPTSPMSSLMASQRTVQAAAPQPQSLWCPGR